VLTRHLPAWEFTRQRWANQHGWTREIHRHPADGVGFEWRASIAEIDQPGAFSLFPGHRRHLVLLEGSLLALEVGSSTHTLQPPYQRIEFDGNDEVAAGLPEGPVRAFNLIHRPELWQVDILLRPLVGPMVFFAEPGQQWLIYLIRGECDLKQPPGAVHLTAGDALLLGGEYAGDRRAIIDGGGELLLVNLRAAGA
jgi:uncharacterized protein